MKVAYYSLVITEQLPVYQGQWTRSIRSLRRFNGALRVRLFVFNRPPDSLRAEAERNAVELICLGNYRDCLAGFLGEAGSALSHLPTLHKLVPLGLVGPDVSQVLFLDCDTFFSSDVDSLFTRHTTYDWYARESPYSRRSVLFPPDKEFLDEDLITQEALESGGDPVPLYNSGVFLLNRGLWRTLGSMQEEFLSIAWRLMLGAIDKPGLKIPPPLRRGVQEWAGSGNCDPLVYPSANFWIIEEIALCLTLARIPGLRHAQFTLADVLQGEELMLYRAWREKCTVAHYFSCYEALFLSDLQRVE